jgi:acyl-CoA synthetase (AMP-forming)/AMP-acid ligase II
VSEVYPVHYIAIRVDYSTLTWKQCMLCEPETATVGTSVLTNTANILKCQGFKFSEICVINPPEVVVVLSSFYEHDVKFRCSSLYGTPTMFIDMLNHEDLPKFDLTSLQTGTAKQMCSCRMPTTTCLLSLHVNEYKPVRMLLRLLTRY